MIKHIVMWTLKPEAMGRSAAENADRMKEMLEELNGAIPGLRHLEVSCDVFASNPECDIVLYSEFDTKKDLADYQAHPKHQRCVAWITQVAASRSLLDFEI